MVGEGLGVGDGTTFGFFFITMPLEICLVIFFFFVQQFLFALHSTLFTLINTTYTTNKYLLCLHC